MLYVRELHERYGPVVSSSAQRSIKSSLNYPIIGLIEEKIKTDYMRGDRRGQISERQMQNRKRKRRKEKSNVMARKQIKSQKK